MTVKFLIIIVDNENPIRMDKGVQTNEVTILHKRKVNIRPEIKWKPKIRKDESGLIYERRSPALDIGDEERENLRRLARKKIKDLGHEKELDSMNRNELQSVTHSIQLSSRQNSNKMYKYR